MRLKRRNRHGAEVPTHSLNDIMFFLLLFFLIISALGNPNTRQVEDPESESTLQMTDKTKNLTVTAEKEYYFENEAIKQEQLEECFQKMADEEKLNGKEAILTLSIDKKLKVTDLTEIIALQKKYKVRLFVKTARKKNK